MITSKKRLVACNSNGGAFCSSLEAAAERIGTDFFSSDDLSLTLRECNRRRSACVVVDYENGTSNHLRKLPVSDNRILLIAVSKGDVDGAFKAAQAGAIGVVEKPVTEDMLVKTLRTAFECELEVERLHGRQHRFSNLLFKNLTDREKDVLALLMSGEPNKRVASILDLGLRTVEGDRAEVMKKLEVSSFVELIRLVTETENDGINVRQTIFDSMIKRRNY